jgi:hypothetical protein
MPQYLQFYEPLVEDRQKERKKERKKDILTQDTAAVRCVPNHPKYRKREEKLPQEIQSFEESCS